MELKVLRISTENDYTLGVLYEETPDFIDLKQRKLLAFTLEDEHRNEKKFGETRIPEGIYRLKLRTYGGFHERYSQKYEWHEGMLEITEVPNFTDILIHAGNTDEDTAGCLLVGESLTVAGFLGHSGNAYERVYKKILERMDEGVWIEFVDYDFK